jgi:hypothetical protein
LIRLGLAAELLWLSFMLRVRIALVALFLIFLSIPFLLPLGYAYAMWLGEPAVATVAECRPTGSSEQCRGTWVGSDGRRHSGRIEGAYSSDIGHRIKIRIGPLGGWHIGPVGGGVQKESISGKIVSLAMLLGFGVVAPVGGIVGARRFSRRLGLGGVGMAGCRLANSESRHPAAFTDERPALPRGLLAGP